MTTFLKGARREAAKTKMASTCSQCGNDGHNSQTCSEVGGGGVTTAAAATDGGKGFMLFGVRVMEGSFRKSASMNNLADRYEAPQDSMNNDVNAGYASDDVVHPSARSRERKRGKHIYLLIMFLTIYYN